MHEGKITGFKSISRSGKEEYIGMMGGGSTEESLTLLPGEQIVRFVVLGGPDRQRVEKIKVRFSLYPLHSTLLTKATLL